MCLTSFTGCKNGPSTVKVHIIYQNDAMIMVIEVECNLG
jgi:hypothetical protein